MPEMTELRRNTKAFDEFINASQMLAKVTEEFLAKDATFKDLKLAYRQYRDAEVGVYVGAILDKP